MFVSVQTFSLTICRSACVNCSRNTLFTIKSQQPDITFLQKWHCILKWETYMGGQQEAENTADLHLSKKKKIKKVWNTHTHTQSQQHEHWNNTDRARGLLAISPTTCRRPSRSCFNANLRTSAAASRTHTRTETVTEMETSWLPSSIHSVCVFVL